MKFEEILNLIENNKNELPCQIDSVESKRNGNYISINKKVPIRIFEMTSMYKQEEPIEVINNEDNIIGSTFYCNNSKIEQIASLSEWKFIALLIEAEVSQFHSDSYEFQYDYLIVEEEYLDMYLDKYYDSAPIWGNFSHFALLQEPYKKSVLQIRAVEGLRYPTEIHKDNSLRVLRQPYAFERYLKMYHHLELLFDKDLVEKIRELDDEDFTKLGTLLKSFESSESSRLESVMKDRITDIDKIADKLNSVESHKDTAKKIFFDFGRKNNDPLDNNFDLLTEILNKRGGFNEVNCKLVLHNKAKDRKFYEKIIIKLSAYWIYRIRCSIAHNKIGEYILKQEEEEFIAEFAEPLLNEIICQAFWDDNC